MKSKWFVILALVCCVLALARTSGAFAAPLTTITVNTTVDELNNDGDCSLREAVKAANTNAAVDACPAGSANDVIELPSGAATPTVYTLTRVGINADNGDLDLNSNITLRGKNKQRAIIEGGAGWLDRIIDIAANTTVTLDHLVVRKGNFGGAGNGAGVRINADATVTIEDSIITLNANKNLGAGIFNQGTLTMLDSTLSENTIANDGSDAHGGGLYNEGTAILTNVIVQDNTTQTTNGAFAEGGNIWNTSTLTLDTVTVSGGSAHTGGGIYSKGNLTISNSTLSGNTATNGGAIYFQNATLKITNSTLSSNVGGAGSGLYFSSGGNSTLSNVTLTLNEASVRGAIFKGIGTLKVKNSIVAGNTAPDNPDCFGVVTSDGNNLLGVRESSCNNFVNGVNGDLVGTVNAPISPKLNALANNGGKTQTHSLQGGSVAIDAGNAFGCTDADGNALTTDQRGAGFSRTLNGFGVGAPRCDMGAYEAPANSAHTATPTVTSTPTKTATPGQITASGVVWNDLDFDGIREDGEPFLQNVTVEMRSSDKTQIYETDVTDANGAYTVHGPAGSLRVHVLLPNGFSFSPQNQGSNDLVDSDIAAIGEHLGYSNTILQGSGGVKFDAGMYTGVTPTPTQTFTPNPTETKTPTPTRTNTAPPGSTSTFTPTRTNTATPTRTHTTTATPTRTKTATATPTFSNSATPTATATATDGCTAKPAKPTLKKPNNNSTISSTRATLKWQAAACATTYNVIVKDVATNKKADGKKGLTVLKFKTKTLAANTTFKWFVQACNTFGCAKSQTRAFHTP